MNWIFWVIALSWIVPFIMRRMGQPGPPGRRPPYGPGPGDRYGRYPGRYQQGPPPNQYPGQQYPGQPGGRLPEGQSTAPQDPQAPWWQQPLPPGFPGQPAPQPTARAEAGPAPSDAAPVPEQVPDPGDAPEGYRAKKLAELDRQFSDQKISLEEYMKARNEVMRG